MDIIFFYLKETMFLQQSLMHGQQKWYLKSKHTITIDKTGSRENCERNSSPKLNEYLQEVMYYRRGAMSDLL